MYFENEKTLWIGTASGVTAMDVSIVMSPIPLPASFINKLSVDDKQALPSKSVTSEVKGENILIEFAAVSTRAPDRLEYSYRLKGLDDQWSTATTNRSIGYSHLQPGTYEFQVRARRAGGRWGPWMPGRLRLRSIAKANRKLREEVEQRTRSIELGRAELEEINSQLSREIEERKRSDALRADVEARFHQAYQNSPIGMALVDKEGLVYDANPTLKALFWPMSKAEDKEPLIPVIASHDQNRFETFFSAFTAEVPEETSMRAECVSYSGQTRQIDFLPSAVTGDA